MCASNKSVATAVDHIISMYCLYIQVNICVHICFMAMLTPAINYAAKSNWHYSCVDVGGGDTTQYLHTLESPVTYAAC